MTSGKKKPEWARGVQQRCFLCAELHYQWQIPGVNWGLESPSQLVLSLQHIWTGAEPGAKGLQHIWRELSLTLPWVSLEQQLWQGGMGSPAQGGFPWVCVCSLSPGRVSQLLSPLHPRTLLRVGDLLRDWFDSHIPWDRTDQTAVLGSWHRISELPFTADRDFGGLIFHQGFCCCSLHKRAVSY